MYRISYPLRATMLLFVDNGTPLLPDPFDRQSAAPEPSNGRLKPPRLRKGERLSNLKVYLEFSVGGLDSKGGQPKPEEKAASVKEPRGPKARMPPLADDLRRSLESRVTRESRNSRTKSKATVARQWQLYRRMSEANCNEVPVGRWCRVSVVVSQEKQKIWIDGKPIRTWSQKRNPTAQPALPDKLFWQMHFSGNGRAPLFVANLYVECERLERLGGDLEAKQREKIRKQLAALRKEIRGKVMSILTPEQEKQ
jgi:hypothetical protein